MQPNSRRRTHSAEFKAQVMAECQKPGASVAAVALARGLNVNLLRKWLVGRGLKRAGLPAPRNVARNQPTAGKGLTASLQFVPVELTAAATPVHPPSSSPAPCAEDIRIELTRGETKLSVRWPSAQAEACSAWLRELADALRE